jgi:hypothetical protein
MINRQKIFGLSLCVAILFTTASKAQEPSAQARPPAPADPGTLLQYNLKNVSRRYSTPEINLRGNPPELSVTAYYGEYGAILDRPTHIGFCVMEVHQKNIWENRDVMKLRAGDKTYESPIVLKRFPADKEVIEAAIIDIPVALFQEMVAKDALHFQIRQTSDVLEKEWLEPLKRFSADLPKKFYVADRPAAPLISTPTTSHDAAKNITTVKTPVISLRATPTHPSNLQIAAAYSFTGKEAQRPATVEVTFSQQRESWGNFGKWNETGRVGVQAGAKRYEYKATTKITPVGDGGSQTATFSIPLTDFEQMVAAGNIEFIFDLYIEPIKDSWLKPFQELLATLPRTENAPQ